MSSMFTDVRISNPLNESRYVDIPDALVNTKAMWTTISSDFASYLQLDDLGPAPAYAFAGADGVRHSFAEIELQGKHIVTSILLSDEVEGAIIGATALAALALARDEEQGRLVERERRDE